VESETYTCGIFTVPMNWDDPAAGHLDLSFVVAKATGENPSPDPLVYLAGGPGQSAVISAIIAYDKIRPTHDIVRLAQRGTGYGQRLGLEECLVLALQGDNAEETIGPILAAISPPEEGSADSSAPSIADDEIEAQLNQVCWEVFSDQGLDLNQFTTAASARDVVELMKALEYDAFNLHGISFGTRLAMTIMADLPTMEDAPELRSVVLDSPFPPSVYTLSALPRNSHDLVLQLFEECQQDESCGQAYPNLKQRLGQLLEALEATPLVVDGQTVTASDVVNTLRNLTKTRAGFMPKMIAELETGVLDTYLALMNGKVGTDDPEGGMGLDLSDPVQVFIANAIPVVGEAGDMSSLLDLIGAVSDTFIQENPLEAMATYIKATYEGDAQIQLLGLLAELTPEDIANSPLVATLQAAAAPVEEETPKTAEQEAAQVLANQRLLAVLDVAHFLNKNIHCNEDMQFSRYEDGVNTYNDLAFPQFANLDYLREQAESCNNWPVEAASIEVKNPLISTVPALILQGAYDTKTPVFMGRRISRELENSTLALVPQQGHEIWVSATDCVGQIAAAFVLNPDQEPDLSCLDARRPQWSLPDDGGVEK
jgi:pimeloyl-ACP methyl ester carboxylesterase